MSGIKDRREGFGGLLLIAVVVVGLIALAGYWYTSHDSLSDSGSSESTTIDLDEAGISGDCNHPTNHNSCIVNGVDSILVGSWILKSQSLEVGGNSIPSKFTGRTLRFKEDGTYIEDYSTETSEAIAVNNPDHPFTAQCKVSGTETGLYDSIQYYNPSDPHSAAELRVYKNPGGDREVFCKDASGEYKKTGTNTTSLPLGSGHVENVDGLGNRVVYKYSVSDVSPIVLSLTHENMDTGVTLKQVFQRAN